MCLVIDIKSIIAFAHLVQERGWLIVSLFSLYPIARSVTGIARTPFSNSGLPTDNRAVFGTTTRSSMLRFRVFHFRIVGVSFLPVFSDCKNLGRSRQRETQRGMCSGAHGKRAAPIGYKLSRGKAFFRPVFGTATPSTGTSETSPRGEGDIYRHFGTATLN